MDNLNDHVTIIIRSVGERTEQLCRQLILAQGVSPDNIVIIRESPFSAALRKSFQIGIARQLPWTFCVDADLLLRRNAINHMLQLAEEQDENTSEVQGFILDKFFGGPRPGGVHLYRTSILPTALDLIPREGLSVRPEFHTLEALKAKGMPYVLLPYVVGLHDFEQYYRDIFRKCFIQAHKHHYLSDLFLTIWREQALAEDQDYVIALKGFAAGVAHLGSVRIDIKQAEILACFEELKVSEKEELRLGQYTNSSVDQLITNWREPDVYKRLFPLKLDSKTLEKTPSSLFRNFVRKARTLGPLRIVPYSIGWFLRNTGVRLQTWVD